MARRLAALTLLGVACTTLPAPGSRTETKSAEVRVEAGSRDRHDTLVAFALPAPARGAGSYVLQGDGREELPLHVEADGRAWFVLPALAAGRRKTYRLIVRPGADRAVMTATTTGDAVEIAREGRVLVRYQGGAGVLPREDVKPVYRRGGYLHPVHTPAGRVVTDDYPRNHAHHHGIWFAWTKTEFDGRQPDFWNMGAGTGAVEFEAVADSWGGAVHAGLRARHRYVDRSGAAPVTVLREVWETRGYAVGGTAGAPYNVFDVDITQECAAARPLALPEYHYGGMALRGAAGWDGEANAEFLTSEGRGRTDGNATRVRWTRLTGRVEGAPAGLAILGHPANVRAPEPVRLHPKEPYLCFTPSQLGRWEIAPGAPFTARYRFVAFDGTLAPAELDRLWHDFADPPRVVVR